MFLPFLPIILALITLTSLAEVPERPFWGAGLPNGLFFLGFWLFCLVLGQVSVRYLGSRRSAQLSGRRLLVFLVWGFLIYGSALDQRLQLVFRESPIWLQALGMGPETWLEIEADKALKFLGLIGLYWLGDALALDALEAFTWQAFRAKLRLVQAHLQLQLPILVLSGVQILWFEVLDWGMPAALGWATTLLSLAMSLGVMVVLTPWVMVTCWGAKPLQHPQAEALILDELRANRTSVARVLAWPDHVLATITAGVIGLVPGCRYLLISPTLVNVLSPLELRAVIAHEAGHLSRYHLLFLLIGFIIFSLLSMLGTVLLTWGQWWLGFAMPVWGLAFFSVMGLLVFFRVVLGFLSRNFERQADCNSLERVGFAAFSQALLKVGWMNGINPEDDNWHHYGIAERLRFLAQCAENPKQTEAHHQRVTRLKRGALAMLVILGGLNALAVSDQGQLRVLELKLARQLESVESSAAQSPLVFEQIATLADLYQTQGHGEMAEKVYRRLLSVQPQNVHVLNNLAWLLVSPPRKEPEFAQEAIELARQALAQENQPHIWDTLAEAYKQAGQLEEALKAAQMALVLIQTLTTTAPTPEESLTQVGLGYYRQRLAQFQNLLTPASQ